MGTRCSTLIFDRNNECIISMYRQFDGYFEGHGQDLANFLCTKKLCNGIQNETSETHANGISCLAAQMVVHFKGNKIGGFYLESPTSEAEAIEYQVREVDGEFNLKVVYYDKIVFDGKPEDFKQFSDNFDYEEE